jgi:hypothetical protein
MNVGTTPRTTAIEIEQSGGGNATRVAIHKAHLACCQAWDPFKDGYLTYLLVQSLEHSAASSWTF